MYSKNLDAGGRAKRGPVVTGIVALALWAGCGFPFVGNMMPNARADTSGTSQMGGMEEGEITAIGSTTLDVAGHMYRLHQKVTIKDDEGRPMELKQLRPGLVIQYRLKEGALHQVIVLLPR